jgi:deoxyribodipyrimidine photo-lyase
MRRALCWIRRDLRLYDHRPLTTACEEAGEAAIVFVFDTTILDKLEDRDDRRVTFIHSSLREIEERLRREHGAHLIVRYGNPTEEIPRVAAAFGAQAVFAGRDYEPDARRRDASISSQLAKDGRELRLLKDQVIFEEGEILSQAEQPFKVYTPYSKVWRSKLRPESDATDCTPDFNALAPSSALANLSNSWDLKELGFTENGLWLEPGESGGRARLQAFEKAIPSYQSERDFPAREATSGLSVHLRFGTVSVRDCVRHALSHQVSGDKWLAELIWREFYQDILAHNPHVVQQPFQEKYRGLSYPGEEEHWMAWCEGNTGYPIVDAAMRCFHATGWMHNRLRMVAASFLTKDLLIDYRRGEAFFARYLLDFDLASNNGGWQWAASTGVDAQPYFRIFNPVLQSKKFDPEGEFIRRWVPELADLRGEAIHWPHEEGAFDLIQAGVELGKTYPRPIVDHRIQRDLAIKLLESSGG